MNNFMLIDVEASFSSVFTETLNICRSNLASVVFPEEDGPERPIMMVVDGEDEVVEDMMIMSILIPVPV